MCTPNDPENVQKPQEEEKLPAAPATPPPDNQDAQKRPEEGEPPKSRPPRELPSYQPGNDESTEKDASKDEKYEMAPGFRRGSFPRPPMARWQYIFWLILLVLIPLAGYFQMRNKTESDDLTQKRFEDLLTRKQIIEMVTTENSGAIMTISGTYNDPESISTGAQRKFRVKVIYSEALDRLIRENCPSYAAKSESGAFTQFLYMMLPTVLLIAFFYFIFVRQMRNGGGAMTFGKSRARRQDPDDKAPITFKDVAGCDEAKEDMKEIVDYLKDPASFTKLGGRIPRGILLCGPPGTGKTLLAKAIAGEAKVPFFSISGSDFVEMFVGVGAARVRDMFDDGKKNAPCLIFIDEIDAVGRSRFSGIGGGHDEREQTLNALLVEMDGFEANQGVIVIAATNRPDVLDPALMRPGRFDRQITVDLPDLHGRVAILKVHAKKTRLAEDVDLRVIGRGTPGFSGADLENLINEAALLATRRKLEAVGMPELEEARDKVRWGRERRSHKMTDKVRRLTAFHEAGHALVEMCCPDAMPLHKITIIPRGMAMGATMSLPKDDEPMASKRQILDMIAVCFGGRTAEELTMDDISTGASQDIRQATDLAKKMVCQWGMSEHLGLINYAGREEHLFLGREITRSEDFSPETAREIDMEIRRIVDEQKARATNILTEHRADLEKLANALLEKETMNAQQVYELLGWPMPEEESTQDLPEDDAPEAAAIREALK
ncbi:MAG: ATP-dependent zinc metalloprotease FtsH [Lentisphaeria bacterium]|nr:ATP-dependent zinc metalloprotease FtsH [Lentisphaeria bacterium]